MTYQHDPYGRRPTDYLDRSDASVGWAPLLLGIAFVCLLGFLMFGTTGTPKSDRPTVSQRSELPHTAPSAPPSQTPVPTKPQ
jgi:hypothetical protein